MYEVVPHVGNAVRVRRREEHLCKALSSVGDRDVTLGDVLLEGREQGLEQAVVVPEQARLRDAAGIQAGEGDARLLMPPLMHLPHRQHVAHLPGNDDKPDQAQSSLSFAVQVSLSLTCRPSAGTVCQQLVARGRHAKRLFLGGVSLDNSPTGTRAVQPSISQKPARSCTSTVSSLRQRVQDGRQLYTVHCWR